MEGIATQIFNEQYYYDRMSLFLNESLGIRERVNFLRQLFVQIDSVYDTLLSELNIFDKNYSLSDTSTKILDQIGSTFNCPRSLTIDLYEYSSSTHVWTRIGPAYITLDDEDYLIYLKLSIIKQHFAGTREEIMELYGDEEFASSEIAQNIGVNFIYKTDTEKSCHVDIYWINYSSFYTKPYLVSLFLDGYLTTESLGITYTKIAGTL